MRRESFGITPDGVAVDRFTLTSAGGVTITVLSYGGVIQSVFAPDRSGALADVTLGYDSLDGYLRDKSYLGSLVGRYANRIRAGRFTLDGREYTLATNAGTNHLHGECGSTRRCDDGAARRRRTSAPPATSAPTA
jgi:aldose 1-epimerase